jgi:hypothetical protein
LLRPSKIGSPYDAPRPQGKLAQFLEYAVLQKIEPYKAFANVYYVGICWVSALLITSPKGHVLVDTLYEPYTDQLLTNIPASVILRHAEGMPLPRREP